jgi:hypothetical protein
MRVRQWDFEEGRRAHLIFMQLLSMNERIAQLVRSKTVELHDLPEVD